MKRLLVSLNAKYSHKGPAAWMLRETCARDGLAVGVMEADISTPPDALLRDIARRSPDVLCFCCYIWNITLIERLTAAARAALPGCVILWGGPEVSYDAPLRMARPVAPDAILAGEGEDTFPAALLQLERRQPLQGAGIVTRDADGGIAPPVSPEKWVHLYPRGALAEPHRLHYAETSRGCPFACRYCLSAVQGGVRALAADAAIERLLSVRDADARTVKVLDRTFNFDGARSREIWRALIEAGGNSTYHFEIAAHLLTGEDIALLRTAPKGLFQFEIGVQTTGERALSAIDRAQDFATISRAVNALRDAGNIHLHLDLIAGLPGDTYEDFARAVDQTLALRPDALQLGFLKLLPGSLSRGDFMSAALPYDPAPPYEVIRSPTMSQDELSMLHDIEKVISIAINSGAFPNASAWLTHFAALEKTAQSLRAEGFFAANRSLEAKFDALRRALPPSALPDLKKDWFAAGRRDIRPWMNG